jgi:hypothetical protein
MTQKTQPWFAAKRATATACALFAKHDLVVQEQPNIEAEIDLLVNLTRKGRETGRSFAVIVRPFLDFPDEKRMSEAVADRIPDSNDLETLLPLVVFAIQVRHLDAKYAWICEPRTTRKGASLAAADELQWHKLDDKAITRILKQVEAFWNALLRPVLNGAKS